MDTFVTEDPLKKSKRTGYVYDETMELHTNPLNVNHPEGPARTRTAFSMLLESGLLEKCVRIESRLATEAELLTVHTKAHIEGIKSYNSQADENVCKLPEKWKTYICDNTYQSATCAAGCVLQMVDAICSGQIDNGIALVRPPGHHAEFDEICGFCFFNNIAIATKHAQQKHGVKKVMIIDWDIHHGNGIQNIFYEDPDVLYLSVHRFDQGDYFPQQKDGNYNFTGKGLGEGFNINIPWNRDKMGNADYKAAFDRVVIPVLNQFKPDLILVASGFDAAAADHIGEYILTPEMFGYMTRQIQTAGGGEIPGAVVKMLLCLEGGYNNKAIGESLCSCVDVLVNGTEPTVSFLPAHSKRAKQTLDTVVQEQSKYWPLS